MSIVCVFNDIDVRRECLDRAVDAYSGASAIEFIPVDNTAHQFSTAGAALNHGARQATNEVVAFAHQDVYLHSLSRIIAAASYLKGEVWGVLGANGMSATGASMGRLRDRVQLIGHSAPTPVDVDSLDEVFFMVRRDRVLEHPLTEDPDLAWHAYAVEYGIRMKAQGLRVGATDLAITHNSLTVNLARLHEAHRRVAILHPGHLPVNTTCGRIAASPGHWRSLRVLRNHGWRLRWLRQSVLATEVRRRLLLPVVLVDIRHDVDLLGYSADAPLRVFNLDASGGFAEYDAEPTQLTRRGRAVVFEARPTVSELVAALNDAARTESILVPDLQMSDLDRFERLMPSDRGIAGIQSGGWWFAAGPAAERLPVEWMNRRAVPLFHSVARRTTDAPA